LREQLPWPAEIVHTIATDTMPACETVWHTRFAAQRMHGEWFQLDEAQVQEFCRTDAVSLARTVSPVS
jgi:hypothetical protein